MNSNKQSSVKEFNDKPKPLVRQPSVKNRKPPEVKQTLTSKYRLLKANPLLMHELEKVIVNNNKANSEQLLVKPLKTLADIMDGSEILTSGKPGKLCVEKRLVSNASKNNSDIRNEIKPKLEIYQKPKNQFNPSNTTNIDFKPGQFLSSTVIESKQESVKNSTRKPIKVDTNLRTKILKATTFPSGKSETNDNQEKLKEPVRSLSSQHLERKRKQTAGMMRSSRKSRSCENLQKPVKAVPRTSNTNNSFSKTQSCDELRKSVKLEELNISTIAEEASFNRSQTSPQIMFRTPSASNRRSIFFTPQSTNNRRSLFLGTPRSGEMSERLNEWLKRRGKSLGDYHHLRCFGIHKTKEKRDESNKENIETVVVDRGSYDDLKIPQEAEGATAVVSNDDVDLGTVAKDALQDLHKLILEGYPCEQCEVWLRLIKEKHRKLEEEPEYWECRAALEQAKGNINNAVECYKTAIIQGAEVRAVDHSLDQLLQKFSLLNINKDTNTNNENKERARIVQDARNIFKSSIIQFAVQERILKKENNNGVTFRSKLTVTPVRRSTRLSRTAFTSTPGVKLFSTLQEAKKSTPHSIKFQHNTALDS